MLKNKICFVSGSSRGIGREIVKVFAENQGKVYANIRSEGSFIEWMDNLPSAVKKQITPVTFYIIESAALKDIVLNINRNSGRIDVWVNNAAVVYNEAIAMISPAHVQHMFETNVYPVIDSIQLVSRLMRRQKSGSIINISSIVGLKGDAGQMAYSATKGAVISLTKSASKELAHSKIRVNAIAPGLTDTKMIQNISKEILDSRINKIGFERMASPEDIADAVVFLASDKAKFITGQILGVDGGTIM